MRELAVSTDGAKFAVDICRRCQFFWFDPSEFERLPPVPSSPLSPQKSELTTTAAERIAHWKFEQEVEREQVKQRYAFSTNAPDSVGQTLIGIFGFPVEDNDPVQIQPWATWILALVIFLVGGFAFSNLQNVIEQWGLIPNQFLKFGGLTLITSFFLHGGWIHLLGNLYFLLVFGDNVEEFLGRAKFCALIFLSAIAGDLLHIIFQLDSAIPMIGASGGISGVIVFYALQFPYARIGMLFRHYRWVWMPVWFAFVLWVLVQFFGTAAQLAGISHVSALAHLGGASVGFLFWFLNRCPSA